MPVYDKIADDFKKALKAGDKKKVSVLRIIKSAIKNKEIEKRSPLNDEEICGVITSFVKRAKESIEYFSKAGRMELVEKETEEMKIIQRYLPEQLNEEDIIKIVKDTVSETGAAGSKDFGKVMKAVMAKVKGRADGKLVNNCVRKALEA